MGVKTKKGVNMWEPEKLKLEDWCAPKDWDLYRNAFYANSAYIGYVERQLAELQKRYNRLEHEHEAVTKRMFEYRRKYEALKP